MNRVASLDVIKLLSMVLVFAIHTVVIMPFFPRTWWSNCFTMLSIACVPLFLMVNGALLLNRPLDWGKWRARLIRLVLLTLFWKLALVLFCYLFWPAGGTCAPSAVIGYLLGGSAPYPQIGYTWFLDAYIGIQLVFPLVKHLYDFERRRYLYILMMVICVVPVGGETLFMLTQPLSVFLDRPNLAAVFLNLVSYSPFTLNAVYLVYFCLGGMLYMRYAHCSEADAGAQRKRWSLFALGLLCFVALYVVNRFQVHAIGQEFDIAQKYTNLLSIVFCCALFVALLTLRYGKRVKAVASFVGKRTFGIFILEAVPIRCLDVLVGGSSLSGAVVPNGSGMPGPLAMAYLLCLIALAVVVTAAFIGLMERVPIVRWLLPR